MLWSLHSLAVQLPGQLRCANNSYCPPGQSDSVLGGLDLFGTGDMVEQMGGEWFESVLLLIFLTAPLIQPIQSLIMER